MSVTVAVCFLAIVISTLAITAWAGRRSGEREAVYAAGGQISATQNGLAIAGDLVSSGAIFGSVALFYVSGAGMVIYFIAPLVGLCLLLVFVAGPLRRLGRFTVGDVLTARLGGRWTRVFAGICTIVLSEMYLVAQFVGAGTLFATLLDISFITSVTVVGLLTTLYVGFGGMLATTWIQIIKATLLTGGVILLGLLCVGAAGGLEPLYDRARSAYGSGLDDMAGMGEGLFSSASLAAALVFGMMGMPHLLIRFLTVPDVAAARRSVVTSALLVALVVGTLLFLVGPGALVFVKGEAAFEVAPRQVRGGNNMVFIHLASAMGGELLYGLFAAIAFSTILAVVAGLGVAIASTVSRDIFATLVPDPERISEQMEMRMFRLTAAVSATLGVGLAILLQHENIAFLSALAFGIAASTNFPILMLALYWRGLTAAGAIAGGTSGLIVAVTLLTLGPTIWEKILKHPEALFPSDYTTLVAAPVTVLVAVLVSRFSSAPGRSETAPAAALQP